MSRLRDITAAGDYRRQFLTQDGLHYRKESQDITPAMRRVKEISEKQSHATRSSNKNDWGYIGSIPQTVLIDWLKATGHTIDQFARNDGGSRCPAGSDPKAHAMLDGGVRSQFLRYFLSRDFSKLHTQHVTTKRERSQIFTGDGYAELRRAKGGDSQLD